MSSTIHNTINATADKNENKAPNMARTANTPVVLKIERPIPKDSIIELANSDKII